ncbi:MAG: HTH domain-containing protein [Clostridiales bacterium]|nr:HTH domain-containing protein [Clostridiales bacterium]
MFEKNLGFMPLFDVYGELLSDNQKMMFELYYGEDFSLSEIAEQMNISRQGVRESIKKCEELLVDFEQKLGLLKILDSVDNAVQMLDNADVCEKDEEKLQPIARALESLLD